MQQIPGGRPAQEGCVSCYAPQIRVTTVVAPGRQLTDFGPYEYRSNLRHATLGISDACAHDFQSELVFKIWSSTSSSAFAQSGFSSQSLHAIEDHGLLNTLERASPCPLHKKLPAEVMKDCGRHKDLAAFGL